MEKLIKAGKFIRVLDSEGNISISNIAAVMMLAKIAVTPALSMQDISLAFVGLIPYTMKNFKKKGK